MEQTQAKIQRAALDLVAFVGVAADFQMMEMLDLAGNLGYILPGNEQVYAVDLADCLQLYRGHWCIQHQQ
ncbi:hypothetical protein D3C81_1960320 [compost metagenome]